MLRFILLAVLGFILIRFIRNLLFGPSPQSRVKSNVQNKDEDFQAKHKNKIEDADFEELD